MILGDINEHDRVLVDSRVVTVLPAACVVAVPVVSGDLIETIRVERLYRPNSDEAARAVLFLLERLRFRNGEIDAIAHRVGAEVLQLGSDTLGADTDGARLKAWITALRSKEN